MLPQLRAGQALSDSQIGLVVEQLVLENVPIDVKADFLSCLARKGETAAEITGFARELRARALQPVIPDEWRRGELLDVVGTGGDRLSTFNISTAVAILCSAAGVRVAKHGNRASTSSIGSADVMEALGLAFDLGPEEAVTALQTHGFAYFFAPKYHPAFRHIIPARKACAAKGQATIFNFLGPLLNPARPTAMLLGVPRPEWCEPLARALQALGVRRAMVVCGSAPDETGKVRYLDELSPLGPTTVAEFYQDNALACSTSSPELFPLNAARLADLRGGDRQCNAEIIRSIFDGRDRGPKREAVLLNAAAALFVAGRAKTLGEGWEIAAGVLDRGEAYRKLESLARR